MAQKPSAASLNNSAPASARKRQQIARSNRSMFLWVAGASVVVAFSIVGSIFLTKQLIFNQTIIAEQTKTADILKKNIDNAQELNKKINQLRANRDISSVPSSTEKGNNLDKILDALPYEGDWVGLGSSLQTTLLSGIALDGLGVDSISEDGSSSSGSLDLSSLEAIGDTRPISFSFKISGSDSEIKTLLGRLDNSIRPIKIISMKLESAGPNKINASIQAITYYQSKKVFELKEKTASIAFTPILVKP